MNEPCVTASSVALVDERDGDVDVDNTPPSVSADAEHLTPGQQLLIQHVKQMTSFLG